MLIYRNVPAGGLDSSYETDLALEGNTDKVKYVYNSGYSDKFKTTTNFTTEALPTPQRPGYKFVGWRAGGPNGKYMTKYNAPGWDFVTYDERYTNKNKNSLDHLADRSDLELWAEWTKDTSNPVNTNLNYVLPTGLNYDTSADNGRVLMSKPVQVGDNVGPAPTVASNIMINGQRHYVAGFTYPASDFLEGYRDYEVAVQDAKAIAKLEPRVEVVYQVDGVPVKTSYLKQNVSILPTAPKPFAPSVTYNWTQLKGIYDADGNLIQGATNNFNPTVEYTRGARMIVEADVSPDGWYVVFKQDSMSGKTLGAAKVTELNELQKHVPAAAHKLGTATWDCKVKAPDGTVTDIKNNFNLASKADQALLVPAGDGGKYQTSVIYLIGTFTPAAEKIKVDYYARGGESMVKEYVEGQSASSNFPKPSEIAASLKSEDYRPVLGWHFVDNGLQMAPSYKITKPESANASFNTENIKVTYFDARGGNVLKTETVNMEDWANPPFADDKGVPYKGWKSIATDKALVLGEPLTHIFGADDLADGTLELYAASGTESGYAYFDTKGGKPIPPIKIEPEGGKWEIPYTAYPKKLDQQFAGYQIDGAGATYDVNAEVETDGTEDMVFVATYGEMIDKIFHDVTFKANNGEADPAAVRIQDMDTLTLPEVRFPGHTFMGWFVVPKSDDVYLDRTDNTMWTNERLVLESMTLEARWSYGETPADPGEGIITITYDTAGGTPAAVDPVEVEQGDLVPPVDGLEKDGYVFAGWVDKATNEVWDMATPVTQNLDLKARWGKMTADNTLTFTVTFDAKGGAPAPEPQQVEQGDLVTQPVDPALDGNMFFGWFNDGSPWNFATNAVNSELTLEAIFAPTGADSEAARSVNIFEIIAKLEKESADKTAQNGGKNEVTQEELEIQPGEEDKHNLGFKIEDDDETNVEDILGKDKQPKDESGDKDLITPDTPVNPDDDTHGDTGSTTIPEVHYEGRIPKTSDVAPVAALVVGALSLGLIGFGMTRKLRKN